MSCAPERGEGVDSADKSGWGLVVVWIGHTEEDGLPVKGTVVG